MSRSRTTPPLLSGSDVVRISWSGRFRSTVPSRIGKGLRILSFAALGPEQAEAQVSAWEGVFERAGFGRVDVLHLHHLTPMHDAASRCCPERPLVTHLHGTELKMLDRIDRLNAVALALDTSLDQLAVAADAGDLPSDCRLAGTDRELLRQTNLGHYRYGKDWATRLERSARKSPASPASRPTKRPRPFVS